MQNIISNDETILLKKTLENFILERLKGRPNEAKDPKKREKREQSYQIETWLADAARRVSYIQLVTHAIKFQNPDARGSSLYLQAKPQTENSRFVSTKTLTAWKDDVVGNAAALDVFKFLQLNHNGETVLARILRGDKTLRAALPGTEEQKTQWLMAFAEITQAKGRPATHRLAKQLYFPVGNNHYHLLAPLFPTSLVQTVFEQIQTRFSETTKDARKARKNNKPYPQGYREYVNLAVQNFGGSKPQNISQLNSARGGKCYLLPSLPPAWRSPEVKPPLHTKSIFAKFRYRVYPTIKNLRKFLAKTKYNNHQIRTTCKNIINQICDELLFYAAQIQSLPAGWSAEPACHLPKEQKFWLDPDRAKEDAEWGQERERGDWREEVSHTFALWLNANLQTDKLRFGDDEYFEWRKLLQRELSLLKEAL